MTEMMDKYKDEEEATLAVLAKKEKQVDQLMFLKSTTLTKLIRKNTRGPLDGYFGRK
jgi:hypothetical protein